jgi:hypothetical protein
MKSKDILIGQYAFETKNLGGPSEEFLEETAPLIGYVVHSFNTLEQELNSAICDLFFDDSHTLGLLVICRMNYAAKVDLFKRLLLDRQDAIGNTMPCFETFFQKLGEAGQLRNTVVHADWESAHDDGYTQCKVKMNRKGMQHEYVQFSPESLQDIITLIEETTEMFETYDEEHRKLLLST